MPLLSKSELFKQSWYMINALLIKLVCKERMQTRRLILEGRPMKSSCIWFVADRGLCTQSPKDD